MGLIDRLRDTLVGPQVPSSLVPQRAAGDTVATLIPPRSESSTRYGSQTVTADAARRSSAKWAAIRLRADLVSTTPLLVKRQNPDGSITVVTDPGLQLDGIGGDVPFEEWLYSSQSDLDEVGNAIGVIEERNPFSGRPTWIRLVAAKSVNIRSRDGQITYHIGSRTYDPFDVWHEKQYTVAGQPAGLSPLAFAAMSLGQNLSALQFGLDYFGAPGLPSVVAQNGERTLNPKAAEEFKARYKAAMQSRDIFVTGKDWDLSIQRIAANESQFLETLQASNQDIARFFGVPGDVIDVNPSGSAITYANITQRFLSLLVLHMQPAYVRRERKFGRDLLPNKVFAKFDTTAAVLRLDPTSDAALQASLVAARILAPDEARALRELPPLSSGQTAQIHDLIDAGGVPLPKPVKIPTSPEA